MAVEDEGSIHACSDLRYCGFRINATHNTSKGKLIMTSGNYQSLENDLEEIQGLLNWSITTPSDITLFQSPGYPLLGGTKGFYRPIYTFKNDKAATIGPTSISVGPLTMGFNGEFRYKEGRNSVSALGIHASALQPWAFKVSVDVNHSEGKSVFTHRFGVEYVARPDNLAYAPAIAFGAMLVYRAMQSGQAPSESELCWGAC